VNDVTEKIDGYRKALENLIRRFDDETIIETNIVVLRILETNDSLSKSFRPTASLLC
jgi:hypothetical protein